MERTKTSDHVGHRFERIGSVFAIQPTEAREWTTAAGSVLTAQPGDWWVTSADPGLSNGRSVQSDKFAQTHRLLHGNTYQRVGVIVARQVPVAEEVETLEGISTARPGDWVVTDETGTSHPVGGELFPALYRPQTAQSDAHYETDTHVARPALAGSHAGKLDDDRLGSILRRGAATLWLAEGLDEGFTEPQAISILISRDQIAELRSIAQSMQPGDRFLQLAADPSELGTLNREVLALVQDQSAEPAAGEEG